VSGIGPEVLHVPRRRLVRSLTEVQIGLVEAGGGYGKSVLAAELRGEIRGPSAEAVLERDTREPEQLLGALRRGLRRAGLSDIATGLAGASADEIGAALALGSEPPLLVIEEVQNASAAAAALLAELAAALPEGARMLLVGRRLDPALDALRAGAAHLDAGALAFDDAELGALLSAALGSEASAEQVAELRRLTEGWPAAAALAASWLARAPTAAASRAFAAGGSMGALLDELLDGLGAEELRRVSHLAHLPLLSAEVADACAGPGSMQLLGDAGLPMRPGRRGWLELADPVRDELAARDPLPPTAARAAADAYADAGELATGLALLSRSGTAADLAAMLAARRWQDLAALELAELRAVLTTLPEEALAASPFALVQIARLAEQEADLELTNSLLERAVGFVDGGSAGRELEAELIAARAVTDPGEDVERRAEAVLAEAGAGEARARARALAALARVEAWRGDAASMLRAESHLTESATLCRIAGEAEWEARTLTALGYRVAFARGDLEQAVLHMGAALALLPDSGSERAAAATFRGEALSYVGRLDDAEAAVGEAAAIGRRLGDHRVQAYAAWTGAVLASLRGDVAATLQRIGTVELHPGDWFEHPTGIEFLADATLALARIGEREEAMAYAARARERADADGYPEIGWGATGAVEARWGDPELAERALADFAASPQQAPRDTWRTLLLRALAASRAGSERAGSLAAQAYEAAAALDRPDLPRAHEPDVAALVEPLALAAGSTAAGAAAGGSATFTITLLGGFGVVGAGAAVDVPAGRPSTLVKYLAVAGAPVAAEEAIELLWPDVEEATGRQRLRNLLNRLRASCGDLVIRDERSLVLAPSEVDAAGFERAAEAAMSAAAVARPGLARTALARYTGELLPGERYEGWAAAPRERLRRRCLDLLDLLTDDAVDRGDVDEAIRLLDRSQEAEPLDEERYLRAAELLVFQGRRGSAARLVERAAGVQAELGIPESSRLARLRASTASA